MELTKQFEKAWRPQQHLVGVLATGLADRTEKRHVTSQHHTLVITFIGSTGCHGTREVPEIEH